MNKDKLISEINRLKKENDAVILAHYYQILDIQLLADFVGDSFALSRTAKISPASTIVFCGVRFMAESAKILSPQKRVLLPNNQAGCPMADMLTPEIVRDMKAEHPDAAVVCYVNSSAQTKAECDICCTSSNAVRVCRSVPQKKIIFLPDMHLGSYVAAAVPEKEFIFMQGWCPVHHQLAAEHVVSAKAAHPKAIFAVHPESDASVVALADFVGSTSEILDYIENHKSADEFIIGTEEGIVERLEYNCPDKKFYLLNDCLMCEDMKKTSLYDLYYSLLKGQYEITLPDEMIQAASASLEKMIST